MPWTAERILEKLDTNPVMVERALLRLYQRQTSEERDGHYTKEANGCGFNMVDADILSSFAEWVQRSRYPEGRRLTPRQQEVAKRRLRKYVNQLLAMVEN